MISKNKVYSSTENRQTEVIFENSFQKLEAFFKEPNIFIADKRLKKKLLPFIDPQYPSLVLFADGSEATKSLDFLSSTLKKVFENRKMNLNRKTKVVVIGGGTLTDFGGFLAQIIKRGLDLVLIPSTWLSAMDSAHGGKNGVNFLNHKNQLGTIYPAKQVILIRPLLDQQPIDRTVEGFGELIKIAYIDSAIFFKKVCSQTLAEIDLFQWLPMAIEAKYRIVIKDPLETKGIRYVLNFGHTLAHVWESRLGIHHGIAVVLGMYFDFLWADRRGYSVSKDLKLFFQSEIVQGVLGLFYGDSLFSMSAGQLRMSLIADKKKENNHISYIFPIGNSKLVVESVSIDEIQDEFLRQKQMIRKNRYASVFKV